MAETKTISLYTKGISTFRAAFRQGIVWSYLIGAESISHYLFGSSWVIDLMVVLGLIMLAYHSIGKATGHHAEMTKSEIRLWVAAGMPENVKDWQDQRKLHEVA